MTDDRDRIAELKTRLRVLEMRKASANFEDREAFARKIRELEAELEELRTNE